MRMPPRSTYADRSGSRALTAASLLRRPLRRRLLTASALAVASGLQGPRPMLLRTKHPPLEGIHTMAIDNDRLMEFVGQFAGDLGATVAAGNVVLGDRLGLYRALATAPATAGELAQRTGTDARYVTEWHRGQAAGGY